MELEDLFLQVLSLAQAMKLVKLGQVSLDGTKIQAHASKHKALSYGYAEKLEQQLRAEVQALLQSRRVLAEILGLLEKAAETDQSELAAEADLPGELALREARLKALAEAKAKIEERVKQRDDLARQEYEAKLARREKLRAAGIKPKGVEPLIAMGRDSHHLPLAERLAPDAPKPETSDPVRQMAWRIKTKEGKAKYAKRKSTVETVFGIVKQVMGFRQFSLRGLDAVSGEWNLVTMAYDMKRMRVLAAAMR